MLHKVVIGLMSLITGCNVNVSVRSVDPNFESYVQSFEAILGKRISFTVKFDDNLDHSYVGMCSITAQGRTITISSYYWPNLNNNAREQVIYHELGHCELNRSHVNICFDGTDGSNGECEYAHGGPTSIMYYMEFGDTLYYPLGRTKFILELFKNAQSEYDMMESDDFRRI